MSMLTELSMDKQKKNILTTSSIVDLKAELLKKQQQYKQEKVLGTRPRPAKKSDLWSRSNAGVQKRAERDVIDVQEQDDLAKSRKVLEAKARLYDAMTSGNIVQDEDGSKSFLVDFERKSIDKIMTQSGTLTDSNAEKYHASSNTKLPGPASSLDVDVSNIGKRGIDLAEAAEPELMSQDMYRERLRQQWEKEVEEINEKSDSLHYSNVQFDEIRQHGVGYFQFNKHDAARKEQLEQLNQLREQTKDARANSETLKAKRKAAMAARLAKVRQRKAIREGKDPASITELNDSSDEGDIIGPEPPGPEPLPLTRDENLRQNAPIRDWDKGKEGIEEYMKGEKMMDEHSWLDKLRNERNEEFAPIYVDTSRQNYNETKHKVKRLTGTPSIPQTTLNNTNNEGEESISATLKSIRSEMGKSIIAGHDQSTRITSTETITTAGCINLDDIPLPPMSHSLKSGPDNYLNLNINNPLHSHQNIYNPNMPSNAYSTVPPLPPLLTGQDDSVHSSVLQQYNWEQSSVGYIGSNASQDSFQANYNENTAESTDLSTAFDGPSSVICAAPMLKPLGPQPAHYSSAPTATSSIAKKPRYERVHLHELPPSLPAPPTANNIPEYPSQEEVIGPRKKKTEQDFSKAGSLNEKLAIQQWQKQFQYQNSKAAPLKPENIPFASPYIQSTGQKTSADFSTVEFDPSMPPPSVDK